MDFNPRSREGSDTCEGRARTGSAYFNPRSREGSDPHNGPLSLGVIQFQSTLP